MYSIPYYFCSVKLNISLMLSFTILRSSKSARVTIYNQYGTELAQCASMNDVFNYFYSWCDKLAFESVIYSQTKDKNVIRVEMY